MQVVAAGSQECLAQATSFHNGSMWGFTVIRDLNIGSPRIGSSNKKDPNAHVETFLGSDPLFGLGNVGVLTVGHPGRSPKPSVLGLEAQAPYRGLPSASLERPGTANKPPRRATALKTFFARAIDSPEYAWRWLEGSA